MKTKLSTLTRLTHVRDRIHNAEVYLACLKKEERTLGRQIKET